MGKELIQDDYNPASEKLSYKQSSPNGPVRTEYWKVINLLFNSIGHKKALRRKLQGLTLCKRLGEWNPDKNHPGHELYATLSFLNLIFQIESWLYSRAMIRGLFSSSMEGNSYSFPLIMVHKFTSSPLGPQIEFHCFFHDEVNPWIPQTLRWHFPIFIRLNVIAWVNGFGGSLRILFRVALSSGSRWVMTGSPARQFRGIRPYALSILRPLHIAKLSVSITSALIFAGSPWVGVFQPSGTMSGPIPSNMHHHKWKEFSLLFTEIIFDSGCFLLPCVDSVYCCGLPANLSMALLYTFTADIRFVMEGLSDSLAISTSSIYGTHAPSSGSTL